MVVREKKSSCFQDVLSGPAPEFPTLRGAMRYGPERFSRKVHCTQSKEHYSHTEESTAETRLQKKSFVVTHNDTKVIHGLNANNDA